MAEILMINGWTLADVLLCRHLPVPDLLAAEQPGVPVPVFTGQQGGRGGGAGGGVGGAEWDQGSGKHVFNVCTG